MPEDIRLACKCGAFKAVLHGANPRTCNHAVCYCIDCQAAARHLGEEARIMDAQGGTQIYQAQPHQLEIIEGRAHLAVMRLAPKGLYRWYTSCCNTSLANTVGTPQFSFVGLVVANFAKPLDVLGPVQFRHKPDQALSPVSEPSGSLARFALRTMRNALLSRLNGKWRETPFFDTATGRAVVKPETLGDDARAAAYQS
ncbi:MAG: DUF6151 family protein [Pseudomonadota bacterium]